MFGKRIIILSITLLCFASLASVNAQRKYHPISVDVGILIGEIFDSKAGILFPYIEPKYNLNNHVSLGLRGEFILFDKEGFVNFKKDNPYWSDLKGEGNVFSLNATADYLFSTTKLRPFIGGGLGAYLISTQQNNIYVKLGDNYISSGGLLRTGVQINRLRLAGEYNFITSKEVSLNYFSIKLGFVFGGAKKRFW